MNKRGVGRDSVMVDGMAKTETGAGPRREIILELPEGVEEEEVERLWKAFLAWLSMRKLRSLLSEEELRAVFERVEEAVWRRHQQS